MTYWAIERAEGTFDAAVVDPDLLEATHQNGCDLRTARSAFHVKTKGQAIPFALVDNQSGDTARDVQVNEDAIFWSWLIIFSGKAHALMRRVGCAEEDFLPCSFGAEYPELWFMHLPPDAHGLLDMDHSRFLTTLPGDPPLPFRVTNLVFAPPEPQLPPCFRIPLPGRTQVLSDLMCTDLFRSAWLSGKLSGVTFRQVQG